ncbi:MAG: MBL fold metallo-hydrolase, partial [Promethearchaeota archaeon]
MNDAHCTITVTCNNECNPLLKTGENDLIHYPRSLMRKLVSEHGLSYHLEVNDNVYIFDMGGVLNTFTRNIVKVEKNLNRIKKIFFSHGHHDHVGGLEPFLEYIQARETKDLNFEVYCHPSAIATRYRIMKKDVIEQLGPKIHKTEIKSLMKSKALIAHSGIKKRTVKLIGEKLHLVKESVILYQDDKIAIYSTGEIPRVHERKFYPDYYLIDEGNDDVVHDMYPDDQALVVEKKGEFVIILLGCCHAGIMNTVAKVKKITSLPVKAIIGGFHLLSASLDEIKEKHAFFN